MHSKSRANTPHIETSPTSVQKHKRTGPSYSRMSDADIDTLLNDLTYELQHGANRFGILGLTPTTARLIHSLRGSRMLSALTAVYTSNIDTHCSAPPDTTVLPFSALTDTIPDVLVVAADAEKEDLLNAARPFVSSTPKIVIAGHAHYQFRDRIFHEEVSKLAVPSLANGYPNSLIHLYECMKNAHRLGLLGTVAEFGMFMGGTTMFLSRIIERLGCDWKIIAFDTFAGFPPRRNMLDMYDHPDCVFTDIQAARRYLRGRNVEIVTGDIVDTCHRLDHEDLVLSFIDTDNYTPATAAINIVHNRTLVGGAIVFDHITGVDRFRYTLGERMAASVLLEDKHYFHLHGTGVFHRQK